MPLDNDTATDEQREAFLIEKKASVVEEPEGEWYITYQGSNGREQTMLLDATTYPDALFEACNIVK